MSFNIKVKKSVLKSLKKVPSAIQDKFYALAKDLKESGPIQNTWPNYSKLSKNRYHCHLTYHYVACWYHEKEKITIEVYYVGSREKAPY